MDGRGVARHATLHQPHRFDQAVDEVTIGEVQGDIPLHLGSRTHPLDVLLGVVFVRRCVPVQDLAKGMQVVPPLVVSQNHNGGTHAPLGGCELAECGVALRGRQPSPAVACPSYVEGVVIPQSPWGSLCGHHQ